jgi:hypothetical protein
MPSFNTFWDPVFGQTLRCDATLPGFCVGTLSPLANCSAILGGPLTPAGTHVNNADLSVIVMGDTNAINTFGAVPVNGTFNFIGNGHNNQISGCENFIGDGDFNQISTALAGNFICGSSIVGGSGNIISDNGLHAACNSFIGGGIGNCVMGPKSFIGSGEANIIERRIIALLGAGRAIA